MRYCYHLGTNGFCSFMLDCKTSTPAKCDGLDYSCAGYLDDIETLSEKLKHRCHHLESQVAAYQEFVKKVINSGVQVSTAFGYLAQEALKLYSGNSKE